MFTWALEHLGYGIMGTHFYKPFQPYYRINKLSCNLMIVLNILRNFLDSRIYPQALKAITFVKRINYPLYPY